MRAGIRPAVIAVAVLTAIHLAGLFIPSGFAWGFHFLAFLGPWHAAAYALLVLLAVAAGASGRYDAAVERLAAFLGARPLLMAAAGAAFLVAAGFLFRVDVPLLGDSWYLVQNFAGALRGTEEVLPRNEPLATWYLSAVLDLAGVTTYAEFLGAFFAGGMLLGAGFIVALCATAGVLFDDPRSRAASFALLCSLPCLILFFGYVETYGAVLFMLSLYALAGALYVRERLPFGVVAVAFLAQVLTHYLTVLTIPSLVYLGYLGVQRGKRRDVALGVAVSCAALLVALAAVGFDVTGYFSRVPHRHYLPLAVPEDPGERYSSPYTLFSPFHFLDLANLAIFLLAPGIALVFARRAGNGAGTEDAARQGATRFFAGMSKQELFLLAAGLPAGLFAFAAKFDLGTARDWDVVAPFSYLFVLLALAAFFRGRPGPGALTAAALIAAVTLLNSALWWTVTGSDTAAVARFRALMEPRLTGQAGMYSASLYLSRYYRQAGRSALESAELWLEYIRRYPGDIRGFRNVLLNTKAKGAAAAAGMIREWSRAFGGNPVTDGMMVTIALESGNEALAENRDADAAELYAAATDVDSGSAPAWNNLGTVLARGGDFAGAAGMFSRAVGIDSAFADAWFNLGRARLATGRSAEAREAFETSARLGNRAAQSLMTTGTVQP